MQASGRKIRARQCLRTLEVLDTWKILASPMDVANICDAKQVTLSMLL